MSGMPLFDAPNVAEPDALDLSRLQASSTERRVYDLVRCHHGYRNPVSIRVLRSATGLTERAIKDAIFELIVTHKVRIGALRGAEPGYFICESAEDIGIAKKPYEAQALAMLRRLRVLVGGAQVKEWLGQQALEMDR